MLACQSLNVVHNIMSHSVALIALAILPLLQSTPVDEVRHETLNLAAQLWATPNRNISEALSATRLLTSKINPQFDDIDDRRPIFATLSAILRRTQIVPSYESFLLILSFHHPQNTTEGEWLEFVGHVFGAVPPMESIHHDVIRDDTIYGEVIKEHVDNICDNEESNQQLLYRIYAAIQETYLKMYVMTNGAWFISSAIQTQNSFRSEFENLTRNFELISRAEASIIQRYLNTTSRSFWRCDPKEHREGVTFTTLKGLLQGYVVNEVDISPDGSCRHGCNHYTTAVLHKCQGNHCIQQKQCHGRLFNCVFYYADMRICLSPAESSRRYEQIQFKNGTILGKDSGNCDWKKVESWWRVLPPTHCTYCFCQCEDRENESERYFSLGSAVADISQNKIVTGVRFTKLDRTIHLQIQQGSLLPHGHINVSSLEWVPVNTSAPKFLVSYYRRKIDLDDLHAPTGFLLTGMRFRELDGRLNPQIMITPFDYNTGILNTVEMHTYWHGNSLSEFSLPNTRRQHHLGNTGVMPTRRTLPDSTTNTYIILGPSNYDSDVGQTTIPLIDIQPVQPKSPSILSGAGIYHRGEPDSAGFVAARIFTYDLSSHIDA